MSDIRLFIASSFDTEHERTVIGDTVRRLNDRYESQGWRIRLLCWEDYEPAYRGLRKQSEYNEDLIRNSDLFIAMFRANCGQFTQEEVKVWIDELHRTPVVLNIIDATVNKSNVNTFLKGYNLVGVDVADDGAIIAQVGTLVSDYISAHPLSATSKTTVPAKEIYATIPDDRSFERAPFGNLVRSVDDLAERTFHCRCRLTMGEKAKIPSSDYYAAILKDSVNTAEESEILTAINNRKTGPKPDVVLYYNYGDAVCTNHPKISAAINGNGIFNEPFDSLCRVKYNLIRWLHQQSILSVKLKAGIDIQNGWFVFFNMPVIPLIMLGITTDSLTQQLEQLFRQFTFAVLGVNTQVTSSSGDIDLDALDAQMERDLIISGVIQDVENEILKRREEWLQLVTDNINTLLSGVIDDSNIGRLTALIDKKEELQLKLSAEPGELLRTQMLMIQVSDTYPRQFATTGRDADAQYLKVAQTADNYGLKDPTVEMMRMNYANYLHRQNRNTEAIAFYQTAMANIESLDDNSELLRNYIMHLYVTYINFVSFLGENERAHDAIQRLIQKEIAWEKDGLTEAETIANKSQILACQLRIRPLQGDVAGLLNHSMTTYQMACELSAESFDRSVRTDVFCDLPNCIAATTIDAQPYLKMADDKVKHNIDIFLGNVVAYAEQHKDDYSCVLYQSEAYHNWAFYYSNLKGEQPVAREKCEKALSLRRRLYDTTHNTSHLYEIAQSLLLLGATYVNDIDGSLNESDFQTALQYADECLSLYESLNTEHYLEQETRVHQAVQLKGSILYYGGRKEDGLAHLKKAWEWNLSHPGNSYAPHFIGVAGEILKKEDWI